MSGVKAQHIVVVGAGAAGLMAARELARRGKTVTLLEAILRSLPNGKSDVAKEDTLEVVRIIEAANESRPTGAAVSI